MLNLRHSVMSDKHVQYFQVNAFQNHKLMDIKVPAVLKATKKVEDRPPYGEMQKICLVFTFHVPHLILLRRF